MNNTSGSILALKPVTFHYKSQKDAKPQFGLIAEEVAEVNPDLVVRDESGEIYTVRYDAVNAMLLNEFLKEHSAFIEQQRKVEQQDRKIQEQEAMIAQLTKQVEIVATHLQRHDSEIQRVSGQLQLASPATHVATTNH
jgi:predicted ribosome quality control (RQC) complex YloA/Tae2 family protein